MILPPTPENLAKAAMFLRRGGLVVMPTETVYGLAADATNPEAIHRVYMAKGRPSDNPLIVHIAYWDQLETVAGRLSAVAKRLSEAFWPGPLTLVLPKHPGLPPGVTAGLDTVAVRMPSHRVALSLIEEVDRPLAAPSANRFMGLSPTRAEHVDPLLAEIILDGGPCQVGLESTVVDCTGDQPLLLRPGGITRGELEAGAGVSIGHAATAGRRRSPGLYARHYAPRARVELVDLLEPGMPGLSFEESGEKVIKMPEDPRAYGAALYDALWRLDEAEVGVIYVERPPDTPDWEAVRDRLTKASHPASDER